MIALSAGPPTLLLPLAVLRPGRAIFPLPQGRHAPIPVAVLRLGGSQQPRLVASGLRTDRPAGTFGVSQLTWRPVGSTHATTPSSAAAGRRRGRPARPRLRGRPARPSHRGPTGGAGASGAGVAASDETSSPGQRRHRHIPGPRQCHRQREQRRTGSAPATRAAARHPTRP